MPPAAEICFAVEVEADALLLLSAREVSKPDAG